MNCFVSKSIKRLIVFVSKEIEREKVDIFVVNEKKKNCLFLVVVFLTAKLEILVIGIFRIIDVCF